jgi:hypothetical protein
MELILSSYVAKQQNVAANTLKDFIIEGDKQGFKLVKPKGSATPVFLSKQGNPQILFLNGDSRLYVRISTALDAALTAGEKINLADSPVYHTDLDNGGKMLVVGMKAEAQEFEAVDAAKAFATYKRPEPAGK